MESALWGSRPEQFLWATGIEDTFVPQAAPRQRALDEYALTGHYDHWREDLALARHIGLRAIRWGIPWYRVEPARGEFDWHWTDRVIPYLVDELNLTPILDLVHYGCPLWLKDEFASPEYPAAVAAYAAAVAKRYGSHVRHWTPLNEPLVTALMCGQFGRWPPYLRGERGYVRLLLQLVQGMQATIQAIRAVQPGAVIVPVETAQGLQVADPALQELGDTEQARTWLGLDLLVGQVTAAHSLHSWLLRRGADPAELEAIRADASPLPALGLNFYPQWSTVRLYVDVRGQVRRRATDLMGRGFAALMREYHRRYQVPILITETSHGGLPSARARWLATSLAEIKQLRAEGVPVVGYTWFPLFTMIDWRYRHGRASADRYRVELGLYRWDGGATRWAPTPLGPLLQEAMRWPAETLGELAPPPPRPGPNNGRDRLD